MIEYLDHALLHPPGSSNSSRASFQAPSFRPESHERAEVNRLNEVEFLKLQAMMDEVKACYKEPAQSPEKDVRAQLEVQVFQRIQEMMRTGEAGKIELELDVGSEEATLHIHMHLGLQAR